MDETDKEFEIQHENTYWRHYQYSEWNDDKGVTLSMALAKLQKELKAAQDAQCKKDEPKDEPKK